MSASDKAQAIRQTVATKLRYGAAYQKVVGRRAQQDANVWTLVDERRRSFYSRFFGHGDRVFDVGANWGNRSKIFMAMGAKVIAVEPQPALAEFLRQTYYPLGNLKIVEAAVTREPGSIDLLIGDSDTLTTTNQKWVDTVQSSGRFNDRHWDRSITVPALTLDQLIEEYGEPRFVKIDIEGGEVSALEGLTRSVHSLSFEFTPECLEDAETCIAHVEGLGIKHFNLSMGESMQLVEPEWLDGDGIRALLARYSAKSNRALFGDIYALKTLD